jgi:UDP-N-acetylglucosamine--N-acetylmuramyl-(pentapeptide) pyrophosphoryl-undecaprenol N-acetylglucosamine transferase
MERFFPADRIVLTGNPIRKEIVPCTEQMKKEAFEFYGLTPGKKHIFIVGGSLGSGTLNNSMKKWINDGCPGGDDVEVLWQCGKFYKNDIDSFVFLSGVSAPKIQHTDFIQRMDLAYAAADVVISRSGASSVSELCAAHKAVIFVPSPNVTEDHQTHNAMALVNKDAAMIVKDSQACEELMKTACELLEQPEKIASLEKNIASLAKTDAAMDIVKEVYSII